MISVVIPHANSRELLLRLLNSLSRQKCSRPFEVLVICNPINKYSEYPKWEYNFPLQWDSTAMGANRARQRGVELSSGEILMFLDDDCVVEDANFLEKHWSHHQQSGISGVGGRYRLEGATTLSARVYHKLQALWLDRHRLPGGGHVHLLGGNSSYKINVFKKEIFDDKIIFGGTESEFQVRLFHQGFKLQLFNDIDVNHIGHLSFLDFIRKSFKQGMGAAYIETHHRRPTRFLFYENRNTKDPWSCRLLEWCYRVSFDAGRSYFDRFHLLRVNNKKIYVGFVKTASRKVFSKEFLVWRELRTLAYVIQRQLLVVPPDKNDRNETGR